eukprot:4959468-Pleurochrysis_carterae.AAC.1
MTGSAAAAAAAAEAAAALAAAALLSALSSATSLALAAPCGRSSVELCPRVHRGTGHERVAVVLEPVVIEAARHARGRYVPLRRAVAVPSAPLERDEQLDLDRIWLEDDKLSEAADCFAGLGDERVIATRERAPLGVGEERRP